MKPEMYRTEELLNLRESLAGERLSEKMYPWEILPEIGDLILAIGETLPSGQYEKRGDNIWVARTAKIFESACIMGPCIIGEETEVRHGAFIRGNALIGDHCVVGNSCELKNVILFNNCEVPHYNYVGDSVLGFHAHMGAGAITSNIKSDRTNVVIHMGEKDFATGFRKMGAVIGDYAEIGCNSVLNPGTVLGKKSTVYPLSMVRGCVPHNHIYKDRTHIAEKTDGGKV